MRNLFYILDKDGNPVSEPDTMKWGEFFENINCRGVGRTEVANVMVSTVFLGIDHQFGDGPPILWETMVFGGTLDGEQRRYSSKEDAKRGHAEMVKKVESEG
jgi:hypothetical protein